MERPADIFQGMSQVDIQSICALMRCRAYREGTLVFNAGEPAECLYFLRLGMVKMSFITPDGREKLLCIYESGDLFGQLFMGKYPYRVGRAKVVSNSEIGKLSQDELHLLNEHYPRFGMNLIAYFADQQRELLAQLHTLSCPDARTRLLGTILCLAKRLCCLNDDQFILNPLISQNDIANLCGMSRSTVSELINEFRRDGILGGSGRHLIVKRSVVEDALREQGFELLI